MANPLKAITGKKARPFLIGGVVLVGAVILFMLVKNSASSGASAGPSGPSEALQMANLASQTQLGVAQIGASAAATQVAAQLEAHYNDNSTQLALANTQAASAHDTLQGQLTGYLANLGVQSSIAEQQAQLQQYGIAAQRDVQLAGIDSQNQIAHAQYDYLTTNAVLTAQTNQLVSTNQSNVEMTIAHEQGKSARNQSTTSTIGTIAVAALAFFSDVRTKKSITWTGIRDDGLSTYRYSYNDENDKQPHFGVIAQQAQLIHPEAVLRARNGRYMVNYGQVGA